MQENTAQMYLILAVVCLLSSNNKNMRSKYTVDPFMNRLCW